MVKTQNVTIRKFDTVSIAKFFALIGFVWGLLAGIIVLAGSLQGYLATGETTLLMSAGLAFVTMILMGVIGGFIGGAVIALAYNRVLRGDHGIRMELDAKV